MKTKYLLYILSVVVILFLYNSFCYAFLNHIIHERTSPIILDYLNENDDKIYEYKKALYKENNNMSVFIKTKYKDKENKYYHFIFKVIGNNYQLIEVNSDIPTYIR